MARLPALLTVALTAFVAPSAGRAASVIGDELTLPQAMAMARAFSPQRASALAGAEAAVARVQQSRAALLPQASMQLQMQRTTSNYVLRPGSLPANLMPTVSRSKNRSYNFFSAQAQLTQLIYDFGNSWHAFRAGQASRMAQDFNTRVAEVTLTYNLQSAYFDAYAAQGLVAASEQTVANMQRHYDLIAAGVSAGTQAAIELSTAESNLAAAQVTLLKASNTFLSNKVALNQAMGHEGDVAYGLAEPAPPATMTPAEAIAEARANDPHVGPSAPSLGAPTAPSLALSATGSLPDEEMAALVRYSMRRRPELAQVEWQRRAQAHRVRSLEGQRLPSLGVQGNFTEQGGELKALAYNWSVIGTLSWQAPVNGLVAGQLAEARATLRAMDAAVHAIRLSLRATVQNAVLGLRATSAARRAAASASRSAAARLKLAEGRFAAGVGNIIELSDAQPAEADAKGQVVQAEHDWLLANAQWQLAMGQVNE